MERTTPVCIDQLSTMETLDIQLTCRCLNVDILVFQTLPYQERRGSKISALQKYGARLSQAAARSALHGSKTKKFLKFTGTAIDSVVSHRQILTRAF